MTGLSQPELHAIAGPNSAGKSTFFEYILSPSGVEFINADQIAARLWPGVEEERSYDAARLAEWRRAELLAERKSFVTEAVFSHESKVELLRRASRAGYTVLLHIIVVPEELTVARVRKRVEGGGHTVPEDKIRSRYRRLWKHVAGGVRIADDAYVCDNSSASSPFKIVATYRSGKSAQQTMWPNWAPTELVNL